MKKIRLLIVDDHEMVRTGLRALLEKFESIEVVGEANSVESACKEITRLQPGVVLLDMRLGNGSGLDVCKFVQTLPESPKVLVLTSYAEQETIMGALSMGADGYLLKEVDSAGLIDGIERVVEGHSVLDPAIVRTVLQTFKHRQEQKAPDKTPVLSPQEMKILALVAEGKTNKEIGIALNLSDKTIKNYFSNVLEKLDLSRRAQAAAYYVENFR